MEKSKYKRKYRLNGKDLICIKTHKDIMTKSNKQSKNLPDFPLIHEKENSINHLDHPTEEKYNINSIIHKSKWPIEKNSVNIIKPPFNKKLECKDNVIALRNGTQKVELTESFNKERKYSRVESTEDVEINFVSICSNRTGIKYEPKKRKGKKV